MLVVIAAIGLLALAAAIFSKVTRAQVRASAVAVETARANALAAAGINLAVLKLLEFRANPTGKQRNFAIAGENFSCRLGDDVVSAEARDEGGKIDLNFANARLLRALLLGLRIEPAKSDQLVDTILDFRDGDNVRRAKGAEEAEYLAAGRLRGPKNAPFAAVEELNQVLGIDAELVTMLAPFVTAHSGKEGIDPLVAPARLLEILRRGDTPLPADESNPSELPSNERPADLPPYFTAPSARNIFTVRSEVMTAGGTRLALEAIVDLSALRPNAAALGQQAGPVYRLWRWRRVASDPAETALADPAAALPECELLPPS